MGRIGCWDKSQKELSATYIKALMNLLGIIDYFSEGDPGFSLHDAEKIQNLNVKVTKREYLLQIPSEKIYGYAQPYFYRCGVESESLVKYITI